MKYVVRELQLQPLRKHIRRAVLFMISAALGAVLGYIVGGGFCLSSRSYSSPYLAWTAQELQDVMGREGFNGPKGQAIQDWVARSSNSAQGYRVQTWKEEARTGLARDWDYQHWSAISNWLSDNHDASIEAWVGACVAAFLTIVLAVVTLLAITWEGLTRGRRRLRRLTRRDSGKNAICIDGVPLPEGRAYEPHVLVPGRTGMGKSVLMHLLIPQFRALGLSGFVPDYGGELIRHHARKGDLIFNPFDRRGVRYSLLADATEELTRVSVSRSFFPPGQSDVHNYFQDAGALILSEALATANTNLELWAGLCDRNRLLEQLKLSPAAVFIEQGTREANSYLTTLMVRLNSLSNLPA